MARMFGRRRVLAIAAGLGLSLNRGAWALPDGAAGGREMHRWQGQVLGAEASIVLAHRDASQARRLIRACIAEIERLESIFSLYREDSALSQLNTAGRLDRPPVDLVRLLRASQRFGEITGGAFDVTVQPLWRLYARHFSRPDADPNGPAPALVAAARRSVDYSAIRIEDDHIGFGKPGMALTLNGIAQGYITDMVAELLRRNGLTNVLIDLGETRALGRHPLGRPWRVGLADARDPRQTYRVVEIEDGAIATSGGYGTPFSADGRHHHIFDPATGLSSNRYLSVTVLASRATTADALSTGCAVLPMDYPLADLGEHGPATVIFRKPDGSVATLSAGPSASCRVPCPATTAGKAPQRP